MDVFAPDDLLQKDLVGKTIRVLIYEDIPITSQVIEDYEEWLDDATSDPCFFAEFLADRIVPISNTSRNSILAVNIKEE